MSGRRLAVSALSVTALLLLILAAPTIDANASGKHNSAGGCSCHSSAAGQVTPSLAGLPSQYNPGTSYALSISGTGGPSGSEGGFSMVANKGFWSNPGTSVKISGLSVTHSNDARRSWTVTWTAPNAGSSTAVINLAVNFANGNGNNSGDGYGTLSTSTPEMPPTNNAPSASNVQIVPTNPTKATGLTLSYSYSDPDGDAESGTTIEWYRDGTQMSNLDGLSNIGGGFITRGQQWQVKVRPSDGTDSGAEVSSNTVTVANSLPMATSVEITPSAPNDSESLSGSYNYQDLDSDPDTASTLEWYLDSSRVPELDGILTVSSLMTRAGDAWQFVVTPNDGLNAGAQTFSPIVIISSSNIAPLCTSVSVAPTSPSTTVDLTAAWACSDTDGDAIVAQEFEWYEGGNRVASLDGEQSVASAMTNKGESWYVRTRVSDGMDWSDWLQSSAVTVQNSAPSATNVVIGPDDADSDTNISLQWDFADADGDVSSGSMVDWFLDGNVVMSLRGTLMLPAEQTERGDVWFAKITPSDGPLWGESVESNHITIANSIPKFSALSIGPDNPDSLSPLFLDYTATDGDDDQITVDIRWLRNGFQLAAVDGLEQIAVEWLGVGHSWMVEIILDDGNGGVVTAYTDVVTIRNLPPIANFSAPETPIAEAFTVLDGTFSTDADGEVVAWFWDVGGTRLVGPTVSIILPANPTTVNLTVIDEHGGEASTQRTISPQNGATVSDLAVSVSEGQVQLAWNWDGGETEFTIWRTNSVVFTSGDLPGLIAVAKTNQTAWNEPVHVAGPHHYTVTVDIDGTHNPRVSDGNTGDVTLSESDMIIIEAEGTSSGAGLTILILFIIATIATIATAMIDRFMGVRD